MVLDVTQMGPGISLWWALLSLAVGLGIVVLIVVKIWRENLQKKSETTEKAAAEYGEERGREQGAEGSGNGDAVEDRVI